MTLSVQCHDNAEYTSNLRGIGRNRSREAAAVVAFGLCENHARLYEQIDLELVQDSWAPAHVMKPVLR